MDKKYTIRIFDGAYTRGYTTEAKNMLEANKKIMALHMHNGHDIIKITTTEVIR